MMRRPLVWIAVLAAALMGALMTSSYIGGLIDPVGHLDNAPMGFVNADPGVGQLNVGAEVQQKITSVGDGKIEWKVLKSQAEAEKQIRDNELWGAIVVPEDFSASIAQIATAPAGAKAAQLDLLANEGSGLFQPAMFTEFSTEATTEISATVQQQIAGLMAQTGAQISPADAAVVGQPVVANRTAVVELPTKAGRGIAPFYLAVMITLTGFLAASIVGIGVDLLRGSERLELFARTLDLRPGGVDTEIPPMKLWVVKAVPTAIGALLGGLCAVFTALVIFGMDVASAPKLYAVGALGAVTVAMISLVFLTLFGLVGELLGVLFTTIFGVPAALGIYPYQAVPGFFRWVSSWHPMRYLSDSTRSIAFYDASGAGLARGVTIVAIWLVGAVVVGAACAYLLGRRSVPEARSRLAPATPLRTKTT
jgi:YhgE/Pip-like protein